MAVYFDRGRSWLDYVGPVVTQLLGGMAGQGFEKNKRIQDFDYAQKSAAAESARKSADRDEILARFGIAPGEQIGPIDMRGDPSRALPNLAAIQAAFPGLNLTGLVNNLNPNRQYKSEDLGDRIRAGSFDPGTGKMDMQEHVIGINPAQRHAPIRSTRTTGAPNPASAAPEKPAPAGRTERAQENARPPESTMRVDENGKIVYVFPDGRTIHSGIDAPEGENLPMWYSPATEAKIAITMKKTGFSREDVIAYLEHRGNIK